MLGAALGPEHPSRAVTAPDGDHRVPRVNGRLSDATRKRGRKHTQPSIQGSEHGTGARRPAGRPRTHRRGPGLARRPHAPEHGHDEAALLALHVHEPWEGGLDAHGLGVAAVDACHQRLAELVQRLVAKTAPDEVAQGLVGPVALTGQHQIEGHTQLARPAEERAGDEGHHPRGHQQDQPVGQRMHPPLPEHVCLAAGVVGGGQVRSQTDFLHQVHAPGLVGDEAVGTALH